MGKYCDLVTSIKKSNYKIVMKNITKLLLIYGQI